MTCRIELKPDARKFQTEIHHPEEQQDSVNVFAVVEQFYSNDLKTMLFLLMRDLCDKESLSNYLCLAGAKDDALMRFEFCKKWNEKKFSFRTMIELLGTMKKFKCLKSLGKCKHFFESEQNSYTDISELSKFIFSVCEELDDDEVEILRKDFCPEASEDICGEELMCLLLLHEKINPTDFSSLKNSLSKLNRDDLIRNINCYESKSNSLVYHVRQPTYTKPSGLAIIINQKQFTGCDEETRENLKERIGSDLDVGKLRKLWSSFGFQIEHYENITEHEINSVLHNLLQNNVPEYDVFVACIMSHGKESCFYSSDCKAINMELFINKISGSEFMAGKPKLFFIQACQGDSHNEGIPVYPKQQMVRNVTTDSRAIMKVVPKYSDTLLMVATINGYVSYRDEGAGSIFVKHLVENIDKFGDKEDINAVLIKVNSGVTKENLPFEGDIFKQQPSVNHTFRKKLILKRVDGQVV